MWTIILGDLPLPKIDGISFCNLPPTSSLPGVGYPWDSKKTPPTPMMSGRIDQISPWRSYWELVNLAKNEGWSCETSSSGHSEHLEVSTNRGTSKWMVYIREYKGTSHLEMDDDWGYPYDETETPIYWLPDSPQLPSYHIFPPTIPMPRPPPTRTATNAFSLWSLEGGVPEVDLLTRWWWHCGTLWNIVPIQEFCHL